jgi:hypothetical protein
MRAIISILALATALPALAADPPAAPAPATVSAAAAAAAPSGVQLQLNLHALRVAAEQDELAADLATRTATSPVAAPVADPGSIPAMRAQMNASMSQLASKCIGVNAVNKGGNQILICGDNVNSTQAQAQNGTAPVIAAAPAQPAGLVPVNAPASLSH